MTAPHNHLDDARRLAVTGLCVLRDSARGRNDAAEAARIEAMIDEIAPDPRRDDAHPLVKLERQARLDHAEDRAKLIAAAGELRLDGTDAMTDRDLCSAVLTAIEPGVLDEVTTTGQRVRERSDAFLMGAALESLKLKATRDRLPRKSRKARDAELAKYTRRSDAEPALSPIDRLRLAAPQRLDLRGMIRADEFDARSLAVAFIEAAGRTTTPVEHMDDEQLVAAAVALLDDASVKWQPTAAERQKTADAAQRQATESARADMTTAMAAAWKTPLGRKANDE